MSDQELLLPEGSVLVHIGPYKTGSTAIQAAMHQRRDQLAEHGVLYPGPDQRQMRPAWGLLGRTPRGRGTPNVKYWEGLVDEVRASDARRVCISVEELGTAGPGHIERLVRDLGADKVHVVAVVRRLDRLMPSAWQERVKSGGSETYGEWLRLILDEDRESQVCRSFWWTYDIGEVTARWAEALPPERFHAIVSDDSDRTLLPRTFEQWLDLPEETLDPPPATNTSMTMDRVEFYRQVDRLFIDNEWPDHAFRQYARLGVLKALMKLPRHPDAPAIPPLPDWATEPVSRLSHQIVDDLKAAGVTVVGEPSALRVQPASGVNLTPPPHGHSHRRCDGRRRRTHPTCPAARGGAA